MTGKRYLGNIITNSPTNPAGPFQDGVASGIWSVSEAETFKRAGLWPTAGNINLDLFVENVFSTFLYTGGVSTPLSINNGIDLSGDGGLVWIKGRDTAFWHQLADTERGVNKMLSSNSGNAEASRTQHVTAFNNNGFTVGNDNDVNYDVISGAQDDKYVSWTFKKASKFFDIVTYTGNGSSAGDSQTITHNLGSIPGMIITKKTSGTSDWLVHHRSLSSDLKNLQLNKTDAESIIGDWNPTSTTFTVEHQTYASNTGNNENGQSYVAYLFGHDTSSDGMIQCGSYTGNGSSTGPTVTLGFEPQWILIKNASSTGPWVVLDNMRGWPVTNDTTYTDRMLWWNTVDAEYTSVKRANPTSTGFQIRQNNSQVNTNGNTYVYMAIRRGPMATPTAASNVFSVKLSDTNTDTNRPAYISNFPVDFAIYANPAAGGFRFTGTRITGANYLQTNDTSAEASQSTWTFDWMDGWRDNFSATGYPSWMWKRAPGFFDVVAVTGASGAMTVNHNLGVAPEFLLGKRRDGTGHWYADMVNNYLRLNTDDANLGSTVFSNFTSTTFQADAGTFSSGESWIVYLFATLAGVSKVGSVTHSGTTNVDCGFTSGSSFVLLKRTDASGGWYVWDSARGIVAGNDPYLFFNDTAAEVTNTDFIDPLSSGFTITDDFTDGDYIFYAIAT
jgi:hypothetical protein